MIHGWPVTTRALRCSVTLFWVAVERAIYKPRSHNRLTPSPAKKCHAVTRCVRVTGKPWVTMRMSHLQAQPTPAMRLHNILMLLLQCTVTP